MKNEPSLAARSTIPIATQNFFPPVRNKQRRRAEAPRLEVHLDNASDTKFSEALLGFNGEALLYCQGISDVIAHGYATEYARMLQNRARGVEVTFPRIPAGLFEPNRNLIRSILEKMCQKYFPTK